MIDTSGLPLPKPGAKPQPAVKVYPDGREVCNQLTKAGRDEYKRRREAMRQRQNRVCGYCGKPITEKEATFEHVDGRGMGGARRDDRIVDAFGKPMNLAVCLRCNSTKGSKRL